jgi:integrase
LGKRQQIREATKRVFKAAGLSYFNPHSFRDALARLGTQVCQTPEQLKAWSQNLGHDSVTTALTSYGTVAPDRQAELIRSIGRSKPDLAQFSSAELLNAVRARCSN